MLTMLNAYASLLAQAFVPWLTNFQANIKTETYFLKYENQYLLPPYW